MARAQSRKESGPLGKWIGIACVCLVAVSVLGTQCAQGQDITGTVTGQVTDPSKAVVSGAMVTVTNQAKGTTSSAVTSNDGEYAVSLLPIGTYTVTISKDGFRTSSSSNIRVTAGSNIRVDMSLQVGAQTEKVEVTGVAPLLQTNSSEVSNAVEGRLARELPLPGRDLLRLATLGPGVVQRQTSSIQYLTDSYLGSSVPTIAGGRGESTSFTMGGINTNNRRVGLPMEKPSVDAVEEFKVLADNYTAEYGQGDGQVIVEFRSGTNRLHGSAYEFLRNDFLNAKDYFDVKKQPLHYNQFGAAVGGPIIKNHTFFFVNYEGTRNPSSGTQGGLFPTPALLNGDFSDFRDAQGNVIPIYDPTTTDPVTGLRTQFPGNIIPAGRIDPIAKNLYALYGAPTPSSIAPGAGNNVLLGVPHQFTVDQMSAKVDHHFARGDSLSTRYSFTDPRTFSGNITTASESTSDGRNQIIGQSWTHTFATTLVNEFRAGYVRQRSVNFPPIAASQDLQKAAGITNPVPFNFIPTIFFQSTTGTPSFNQMNGFSAGGGGEVQQAYQFVDNIAWVRGGHTFKFGTDIRRRRWDTIGLQPANGGSLRNVGMFTTQLQPDPNTPGNFIPVQGTGSGLADFLLGQLTGVDYGTGLNSFSYRDTEASWFAQDTWRVTPKLTVMLGLRWDYQGPISETHGKQSWVITDSRCPLGCLANDGKFGGTFDPIVNPFPGKETVPPGGIAKDLNNFGPRISVAYEIGDNTVFRAGYGVFFSNWGQNNFPGATNPPFGSGYLISSAVNDDSNPLSSLSASSHPLNSIYPPIPPLGQTVPGSIGPGFYFDIHNVQPSINNASAALQHAFTPTLSAEIGYLGSFGRHLTNFLSFNDCTTDPCTNDPVTGNPIRQFPNFAGGALMYTTGVSSYNGGYVKVEKRFSHGLSFLSSWTWSRGIATGGDSEGNDIFLGSAGGIFNPLSPLKHLSVLDVTHRFVNSGIYELPFGRGKQLLGSASRGLDQVVGGWQVSFVAAFQSGSALDLSSFGSINYKYGQGKKLKRLDFRKTGFFFDPNLFTTGPGDEIPYTAFRGAGINDWDFSILKNFRITETHRLQFRAELYNAWNHGQFETPGHVSFFPGFGTFQARNPGFFEFGSRPARNIELGLKYEF